MGDIISVAWSVFSKDSHMMVVDTKLEPSCAGLLLTRETVEKLYCVDSQGIFTTICRRQGHMHGIQSMATAVTFQKLE